MTQIIEGLYLANKETASQNNNHTLVVNCTPDLPFYYQTPKQMRISVWDRSESHQYETMKNSIPDIIKEIEAVLKLKQNVLVYCAAGQSRSATIIGCYLLWRNDWTIDQTVKFIKSRDSNAFFGGLTFCQVLEWVHDNKDKF